MVRYACPYKYCDGSLIVEFDSTKMAYPNSKQMDVRCPEEGCCRAMKPQWGT